jgi:hypothetical protein
LSAVQKKKHSLSAWNRETSSETRSSGAVCRGSKAATL